MHKLLNSKYNLIRKIGSGGHGVVYLGIDTESKEEVAIKIEKHSAREPQLRNESDVYRLLQGGAGIPRIKWYGIEGYNKILVMELLGKSLRELFELCSSRFTLKTVLMLADQMIGRIEFVHSKHFIHRSIKPENFVMGIGRNCRKLFIIDFGRTEKFRNSRTRKHMQYREDVGIVLSTPYTSINGLRGILRSRRDDLESLGYVLMHFIRGSLPWQGIKAATMKQRCDKAAEIKLSMPAEVLCEGFPAEFSTYLNYCRGLRFEETPDYIYLRQLFRSLFCTSGYKYDYIYDWTLLEQTNLQKEGSGPEVPSQKPASSNEPLSTAKSKPPPAPISSTDSLKGDSAQQENKPEELEPGVPGTPVN